MKIDVIIECGTESQFKSPIKVTDMETPPKQIEVHNQLKQAQV